MIFPPFILLIAENSVNNISLWVGKRLENDGQYMGSLQGGQEFCSLWFPPPLKQCLAYRWCSTNTCYQVSSQVLQRQRWPRSFPIFHCRQKADILKDDYKAIWKKNLKMVLWQDCQWELDLTILCYFQCWKNVHLKCCQWFCFIDGRPVLPVMMCKLQQQKRGDGPPSRKTWGQGGNGEKSPGESQRMSCGHGTKGKNARHA